MNSTIDVLLIGASVRGLAMSALRAGLRPWAADLFADADLRAIAPTMALPLERYPSGFRQLLADAPPGPVIYTGGLENAPRLLDAIARDRPLWGNPGDVVRRVRWPFAWYRRLREMGLPALEVFAHPNDIPRNMSCVRKPLRGAGGLGIAPAGGSHRRGCYYQRFITGECFSALFLGSRLVAVTEQLIDRFRYVGSIAPRDPIPGLERIGEALAAEGVRGLVGVDGIVSDGVPWIVEVNPRPTASLEVVEWAMGRSLLREHIAAFVDGFPPHPIHPGARGRIVGKRVVYADRAFTFERSISLPVDPWIVPEWADIPEPGTRFEPGQPVMTVFATGTTREEVRVRLNDAAIR